MPKSTTKPKRSLFDRCAPVAMTGLGAMSIALAMPAAMQMVTQGETGETLEAHSSSSIIDIAPTVDLGQGDTILGDREDGDPNVKNRCTVGFIDEANAQMYTAGHCVVDGGSMYSMTGEKIGTAHRIDGDRAVVNLDTSIVTMKPNAFSPGGVIRGWQAVNGTEVCSYGQSRDTVDCGKIVGSNTDGSFSEDASRASQRGDSGGPVWLKDTGELVGLHSGVMTESDTGNFVRAIAWPVP